MPDSWYDMLTPYLQAPVAQCVRDLAWTIASPGLLQAESSETFGALVSDREQLSNFELMVECLTKLCADATPLEHFIHSKQPRFQVGRYFETLVEYWLCQAYGENRLASHVAVRRDKVTLGEYDYLVLNHTGECVEHWEVAFKLYIKVFEDSRSLDDFMGPMLKDTLSLKTKHLFQRQLALSQNPMGMRALPPAFQGLPIRPRALLKGYLFHSLKEYLASKAFDAGVLKSPAAVSPNHCKGWWARVHHADSLQAAFGESVFVLMDKPFWISPLQKPTGPDSKLLPLEVLLTKARDHLENHRSPLLVAQWHKDAPSHALEASRGFIVGERWALPEA